MIDIIKLNHWFNARKITSQFINNKQSSLTNKLKSKKKEILIVGGTGFIGYHLIKSLKRINKLSWLN